MQLSQKRETFSGFFWHLVNLDSILNIFRKKSLSADVFLKLHTPKNVVR